MEQENKNKKLVYIEDVITKNPELIEPCLVTFSNGVLKESASEQIYGSLYRNTLNGRRQKERILKVDSEKISYIGKNFGPDASDNKLEKTFLGILDKKTNKMKLIEMSTFSLEPHLNKEEDEILVSTTELSYHNKIKQLTDAFGGRKSRALLKKKEERVPDFNAMGNALKTTMNSVASEEVDLSNFSANNMDWYKDILPPCNRDKLTIQEVYPLDSIISDMELIYFNDMALEVLDQELVGDEKGEIKKEKLNETEKKSSTKKKKSDLFDYIVAHAKFSRSESKQCKRICIAFFIEQLIHLLHFEPRNRKATMDLEDCPPSLRRKVMSFKFVKGKQMNDRTAKEKLKCHIIVLSLIACKYEVPFALLQTATGSDLSTFTTLLQIVGASSDSKRLNVILKLPLAKIHNRKSKRKR